MSRDSIDTREWLITNGLGSFASGTVCDARTRTYHGWLVAAAHAPSQRTLLLSHLEASLSWGKATVDLGTNFWQGGAIAPLGYQWLQSFTVDPIPTWCWGNEDWQLTRRLIMPYGLSRSPLTLENRVLIEYGYQGKESAALTLRLFIGDRNFHHQQIGNTVQFSQSQRKQSVIFQGSRANNWQGILWQLQWSHGHYSAQGIWYWNYHHPEEQLRGLGHSEDLYSPGYLTIPLEPGDQIILEAKTLPNFPNDEESLPTRFSVTQKNDPSILNADHFEAAVQAEETRLKQLFPSFSESPPYIQQLLRASDQFVAYRASTKSATVIAGYHWFSDWGRDTLIALPGLALVPKRYDLAKELLATFAYYCEEGIIPNTFPDEEGLPIYNSIDASLWWIESLGLYLEATEDWNFLEQNYPIMKQIYKAFCKGTRYNIQVDAIDGLLTWDAPNVALTWMDAVVEEETMTARRGKAIEINALWYSALCWMEKWAKQLGGNEETKVESISQKAELVKESLQKFWNPQKGYLYDFIDPDDNLNKQIRPNAVIALSLSHCAFPDQQGKSILEVAKNCLLTPYGLRSLDPGDPSYIGCYQGDRWHRDKAYHNGTVWSWLIGPFMRAWQRFYPETPIPFDWQPLRHHLQQEACLGSISEIFDGDAPHSPKGAIAQAWSVAEILRCLME